MLERLDGSVVELERAAPEQRQELHARVVAVWETRFHDLLEESDDESRRELVRSLDELVRYGRASSGEASAGDRGFAVAGTVDIRADRGSAAAGVMGDVAIGNPQQPGPGQS
ncbi:hypothetical protein ACIBU0_02920 [Streptomyces sp. NPDC049627]|uniref:hypothetical protein n=1 Tax=Streptomyces sp. NPDC049627 TaxID=3365595 RepID=UPI003790AD20